jgi:hypothetical protein
MLTSGTLVRPEHEPWAVALWVEKHHGGDGPNHIAEQVERLAEAGDFEGVAMWRQVAERYGALKAAEVRISS